MVLNHLSSAGEKSRQSEWRTGDKNRIRAFNRSHLRINFWNNQELFRIFRPSTSDSSFNLPQLKFSRHILHDYSYTITDVTLICFSVSPVVSANCFLVCLSGNCTSLNVSFKIFFWLFVKEIRTLLRFWWWILILFRSEFVFMCGSCFVILHSRSSECSIMTEEVIL